MLRQNLWVKEETGSWLLSLVNYAEFFLFSLVIILLPTQFGKHFWPNFSILEGLRIDYLSPTLYATDLLLIALFIISLLRKKLIIHPLFSLFLLFLGFGIYFSSSPFIGWYYFAKFLEISFFAYFVSVRKISHVLLGIFLSVGILFESFVALGQMLMQGSLGGVFYFFGERSFTGSTPGIANASVMGQLLLRPYATFSHPNMLAGYIVAILFLLFYLLVSNRFSRLLLFMTTIIGVIGIAISLSRTAITAWLIGVVVCAMYSFKKSTTKFIFVFVVAILPLFLPDVFFRFLPFSFGQSITERALLAEVAFRMFLAHPIFGVGLGNFLPVLSLLSPNGIPLQPAHTIYLLIASEVGIIGLGSFLWFFWRISMQLFQKIQKSTPFEKMRLFPLLLSFVSILFMGLFDHYWLTLQQGQLVLGLVVGLIFKEISHDTIEQNASKNS